MTGGLVASLVSGGFVLGSLLLALVAAVQRGWLEVGGLVLAVAPSALLLAAEVRAGPPPSVGVCDAVSLIVLGALLALAAYLSTRRPPPPPPPSPAFVDALANPPPPTDALRRAMANSGHPLARSRAPHRDPVCSSCVVFVRSDSTPGSRLEVELDTDHAGNCVRAPCAWCGESTPYRARWVPRAVRWVPQLGAR